MHPIILKLLFSIQGIGAASGLIHHNGKLHIISDNSNYLYSYAISQAHLDKQLLLDRAVNEAVPKKQKADFESITSFGGATYLFGSGSLDSRNTAIRLQLASTKVDSLNMAPIYQRLQKKYGVAAADFNIEGAVAVKKQLWLFNRGNGPKAVNGIYKLLQNGFKPVSFTRIALPKLNGVQLGFTDAVKVGRYIYFTAAAEGTSSSYDDGQIQGTVLGRMRIKTMKIDYLKKISKTQKFEGITLLKDSKDAISFLLCEDPDNGQQVSDISSLRILKKNRQLAP